MIRVLVFLVVLAFASDASAQTLSLEKMWRTRVERVAALRDEAPLGLAIEIEQEIDIGRNLAGFALFAFQQGLTREFRLMENARTDKQLGAPAGSEGSTSLVSKGAVPSILGFAVEHGALTQTGNETSVTLRGNGVGWLDLLANQDFIASYQDDSTFVRALRRLSYSLTFNAAPTAPAASEERPDPAEVEAAADQAQQLASYSVRVAIIDQRDPRRADNRSSAMRFMEKQGADLLQKATLFNPVLESDEYHAWLAETVRTLSVSDASAADLERRLYARLEILRQVMLARIPGFEEQLAALVKSLRSFEAGRTEWFTALQRRLLVAAEVVRNRAAEQPASVTYRLIAEGRPGTSLWDLTGNVAFTRQDAGTAHIPSPEETRGMRDIQLALQAERPFGQGCPCRAGSTGAARAVLSFEYLGRYLDANAVINFAGFDFAVEQGWIHAAQAKVTIPVNGSGVKIPLSVSVANRTELIRERTVRAHFGLTFDLDVIASAVRR